MGEHVWRPFSSRNAEQFGIMTAAYRVIATGIHPAILSVNRQTYSEASRIMYSENCFDFCGTPGFGRYYDSEAVIPFLESLSEDSRRLIKQIEFRFGVTTRVRREPGDTGTQSTRQVFKETCDYLGQNLQLKHVILRLVQDSTFSASTPASFKDDLLAFHEKAWEQHLVPLVRGLDTCELTTRARDNPEVIYVVQEYLKSKMPRTSRPTFSTRTY